MPQRGKVYLVGAGPGDPGLLTVKGLRCLQQAEVILYDGLVNPLILRLAGVLDNPAVRAERASARETGQREINDRLVDLARNGKTVVRLKGGDPFIFGRGSEEAAVLAEANIDFEVVPGVTAAVAAGEYAGLSFTHRQHASAVAFVTAQEDPQKNQAPLDYETLARFPGTLVFYMGLKRLNSVVEALVSAGKPASTPSCVISSATNPGQRTVTAPLSELPDAVAKAVLRPPSIIVVGQCVDQRTAIAWYERRPLFGLKIGITRPAAQAEPVLRRVLELGAEPVLLPTIEIHPPQDWGSVDAAISRLESFDWLVFTSANGVSAFLGRLWDLGGDARRLGRLRIASIGPSTADVLKQFGLRADLVPAEFRAEPLAEALVPRVAGKRVLWARGDRGRDVLSDRLKECGAMVEEVAVYRNVPACSLPQPQLRLLEEGQIDWIGLGSSSIAESLAALCTPAARARLGNRTRLASISPVTTEAAARKGLSIAAEATEYTWDGLVAAIIKAHEPGSLVRSPLP